MSEWISIEDQIPDEHEPVIISGWNFNNKEKGRYVEPAVRVGMDFWPPFERDEGFIKILLMEGEPFHQPTHWMPLPAAPGDTAQPADAAQESPEDLVVWRIIMPSGEVCHFGTEAMAKAWGRGSGTVERVELKAPANLRAVEAPVSGALELGLYAIHYRDNFDGEGDTYYLIAQRTEDGRWLKDENGRELLEYEGDAVLEAWPLTSGTTSDKYRAELYDEVWEKARALGYGNVTEALADLERMKAAEQPDHSGNAADMVHCACGDAYPGSSFDAGFIIGSGMCQNCDAAIPAKDIAAEQLECDHCGDSGAIYGTPCGACAEPPDPVKVPRELLSRHLDEIGEYAWDTYDEMRALLGKEGEA